MLKTFAAFLFGIGTFSSALVVRQQPQDHTRCPKSRVYRALQVGEPGITVALDALVGTDKGPLLVELRCPGEVGVAVDWGRGTSWLQAGQVARWPVTGADRLSLVNYALTGPTTCHLTVEWGEALSAWPWSQR